VNFLYLFYRDFAKIYGLSKILQKYTSGAVVHGIKDITSWAAALGAASSGPVPHLISITFFLAMYALQNLCDT
jgi:phage gp29-like protein